jgi:hypothetical protein
VDPDGGPPVSYTLVVFPGKVKRLVPSQLGTDDDLQVSQRSIVEFNAETLAIGEVSQIDSSSSVA